LTVEIAVTFTYDQAEGRAGSALDAEIVHVPEPFYHNTALSAKDAASHTLFSPD
jgi:hypothetical protein